MKLPWRTPAPDPAYAAASARAGRLWDMLDRYQAPGDRGAIYDELGGAYAWMAASITPGQVPAGYDGDLTADLRSVSALCWVLGQSEYSLVLNPGERPALPSGYIPGAVGDPRLAAAWQLLWDSSDRALRAALLRGHPGGPASRGEQRRPDGIVPLTARYAGSAVTGFLEHVADAEEILTSRAARAGAVR